MSHRVSVNVHSIDTFSNFQIATGEPNNWMGTEECVEMFTTTGTWNDNPCYYQRGVACKKGVNSFPVSTEGCEYV